MNFYKRFIGDIQRDTGHLSCSEMGVYDRLLDHYYATESALPGDIDACCRIAKAIGRSERKAVIYVLNHFFTITENGYEQKRANKEIAFFIEFGRWSDEKSLVNKAFNQAMRHSRKLKATPVWLTEEHKKAIALFYKNAKALSTSTLIEHHVDHIIPLKGKLVSGLNVPWNLQILTATENCRKSNKVIYE